MANEAFFKSKTFKFFIPIFIVACIIKIFSGGFAFGNWLYHLSH
jgi:hypothetical protein